MNYRVYLSYSLKDSEIAKDLARRLSEAGVQVSHATDKVERQEAGYVKRIIRDRLGESDEVIVLLTDTSANNPWVRYEMGAADALDKRLTPVVVHDGVEQQVPMVGKNFIKYADLPKYISSLKRRAKAA